jgi:hypothetical protein
VKESRGKYKEEYLTFLREGHICQCGCGQILSPSYDAFRVAMDRYGVPPRYIRGHNAGTNVTGMIECNGCRILLLNRTERCEKGSRCENYLSCLSRIAKIGARGWRTV